MSKVRICFLGTSEFAATCLDGLLKDEHYEVSGVVTQPDRPSGRKMQLTKSPVKIKAEENQIVVLSPNSLKADEIANAQIKAWNADIAVVVAYGQILVEGFLKMFPLGCVNVHASLLPRWRGAAPIQRAIEAGDEETGVCLQKMVLKLDAGDVLGSRKLKISPNMNSLELHDELAKLSKELLHTELMDYIRGNLSGDAQDESLVTYAKKIEKSESELDWSKSSLELDRKIRALAWGPGTYTTWNSKKLKIKKAVPIEGSSSSTKASEVSHKKISTVGSITKIDNDGFWVSCGSGNLKVLQVQPESRNQMSAMDFVKGSQLAVGEKFGV